jgi:hypothetical protein
MKTKMARLEDASRPPRTRRRMEKSMKPQPVRIRKGRPVYAIEDCKEMDFPYPPEPEWEAEWKESEDRQKKAAR